MSERLGSQMRSAGSLNYIRMALRARGPFAVLAIAIAALGVLANISGIDVVFGGQAATHPVTALTLIALAGAVFATRRFVTGQIWRAGLLGVVLVVCAARLMDAGLTQIGGFAPAAVFRSFGSVQGAFSIEAAMVIGAFAAAALAHNADGRWGGAFLSVGLAVVFTAMVEVSYGMSLFNGHLSALTFGGLLAISVAMLSMYMNRRFVRVAFLQGAFGVQTRIMVAAIVLVPWLTGLVVFHATPRVVAAVDVAMISISTFAMLLLLLTTAARHESVTVARRRAERERAARSRVDTTTGALSRLGMTELVEGAWVDFKGGGDSYGVILLDLEFFRRLDATHGKNDGEQVLTRLAATLQPQLRAFDAIGRWGRDEFLILLHIKDVSNLFVVATRLKAAIANVRLPFAACMEDGWQMPDVPLGLSEMRLEDDAPTDAIARADQNLHLSKVDIAMPDHSVARLPTLLFGGAEDKALAFRKDHALEGASDTASLKELRDALDDMITIAEDAEGEDRTAGRAA